MALQFRAAAPINVTSSGREQGPWTTKLVRCQSTLFPQCRWRPDRNSRMPSSFSKFAISCSSVAFSSQSLTIQSAVRRRPNLAVEGNHQGLASVRSSLCGHISLWRKLECSKSQERQSGYGGQARASMRLDPGGGRGPNGGNNGIGRIVFNLALAGGLTYLTVTGKLGWLFDAFISLWLLVVLVPIVGIVAFLWFADREIISSVCPNCGNPFQVLEFTMKDEQQFCPYCSQPFKLEGKQFVREGPRFATKQSKGFRPPFGGFGQSPQSSSNTSQDPPGVIVDVEAEVVDRD